MIPRVCAIVLATFFLSCSTTNTSGKSGRTVPRGEGTSAAGSGADGPVYRPKLVTSHSEDQGGSESNGSTAGSGDSSGGEDMEVSGLGGTIDEAAVSRAFDRKKYEIEQCVLGKARAMTYLEGAMNFQFTVFPDGRIDLKLLDDDLGHFEVEACLYGVVKSIRLGRPKGGKVKISYPLRIPNRGTPHISWGVSRVRSALRSVRGRLRACKKGRRGKMTAYMYVLPGGRLIALGVSSRRGIETETAQCAFEVLKDVQFPDPLGKVVKIRYSF